MQQFLNPLDRPDCDPQMVAFLQEASAAITTEAQGKDYVFIGDTDHRTSVIPMFVFSRTILETLHKLGVKHLMTEHSRSAQVFVDAVADGRLTPQQYAMTTSVLGTKLHVTEQTNLEIASLTGAGIQTASELGIRIHCVNGQEGMLKTGSETKYHFQQKRLTTAWLDFVLKTPKYFDDPATLMREMVVKEADHFMKKHRVDLKAHAASGQMSPSQLIFQIWFIKNEGHLFQEVKHLMKDTFKAGVENMDATKVEAIFKQRLKADRQLFEYMDGLRQSEKVAAFYGFAHINGGFAQNIAADRYSVVAPIHNNDPMKFIEDLLMHMHEPNDLVIFISQMAIAKFGDLLEPAARSGSSPKVTSEPFAPK